MAYISVLEGENNDAIVRIRSRCCQVDMRAAHHHIPEGTDVSLKYSGTVDYSSLEYDEYPLSGWGTVQIQIIRI